MTGPAWYWGAGTVALILWAWVLLGLLALPFIGRWLRHAQPVTKPPAPRNPRAAAPGPRRGRLKTVVKTWECGCREVWRSRHDILHFPCPSHLTAELKDLTR